MDKERVIDRIKLQTDEKEYASIKERFIIDDTPGLKISQVRKQLEQPRLITSLLITCN